MNNKPLILSGVLATVPENQRNTLYINVARAIRAGQLTGLRLVDRITLISANGLPRDVHDYVIIGDTDGAQLVARYAVSPVSGVYTRAQAEGMSEAQLLAAVAQQVKRRRRAAKDSMGGKNGAASLTE